MNDFKEIWKQQRERKAFLALADGAVFHGCAFGYLHDCTGEAVFNTGMTGYQEIISDPSYAGQFVTLTTAEVGNYGCNQADMESRGCFLNGLVIQELNPASNWRSEEDLDAFMTRRRKPGLAGVDTRALTLHLRTHGSQKAYLHVSEEEITEAEAVRRAQEWEGLDGRDYASIVTTPVPYDWNDAGKYRVIVYDFGVKYNILRMLAANDVRVTVVPAATPAETVLAENPDGVFLSNGPADPSAVTYAIDKNASVTLSFCDSKSSGIYIVREIRGLFIICPEVDDFVPHGLQLFFDFVLHACAGMVICHCDLHPGTSLWFSSLYSFQYVLCGHYITGAAVDDKKQG